MLEAIMKVWPILAFFLLAGSTLLTWIGLGVWRIAQWTQKQDLEMEAVDVRLVKVEDRLDGVEAKVSELQIATAKLSVKL